MLTYEECKARLEKDPNDPEVARTIEEIKVTLEWVAESFPVLLGDTFLFIAGFLEDNLEHISEVVKLIEEEEKSKVIDFS